MGSLDTLFEIAIRVTTKGCPRGGGGIPRTKSAGVVTAAVQPSAAVMRGVWDNKEVDMMLDSGSPISLIEESVAASFSTEHHHCFQDFVPLFDASKKNKAKICTIEVLKEPTEEAIDDCAVPLFVRSLDNVYDMPPCVVPTLSSLLEQYKSVFRTSPGSTTVAEHFIPTTGTPVKVPPRRIPANYRLDVEKQIQTMLKEGIIEESSSPWLAPAVFVRKKTGDIRICVDYHELNKRTV